jgi:hypothetical protein
MYIDQIPACAGMTLSEQGMTLHEQVMTLSVQGMRRLNEEVDE